MVEPSTYAYAMVHEDTPPLYLVTPYWLFSEEGGSSNTITRCNVDPDTDIFVGMKGFDICNGARTTLHLAVTSPS